MTARIVDIPLQYYTNHGHWGSTKVSGRDFHHLAGEISFHFGEQQAWLASFTESLHESTGIRTLVEPFDRFEPKGNFCISFLEMFGPFLHGLNAQSFHHLQRILADVEGTLWVSAGGITDGAAPEYGLHQGLLHSLRMEYPNKRLISLNLEPENNI